MEHDLWDPYEDRRIREKSLRLERKLFYKPKKLYKRPKQIKAEDFVFYDELYISSVDEDKKIIEKYVNNIGSTSSIPHSVLVQDGPTNSGKVYQPLYIISHTMSVQAFMRSVEVRLENKRRKNAIPTSL